MSDQPALRIAVIGGGGHVGLPLSLLLAKNGFTVHVIDIDDAKMELLKRGQFPFLEEGGAAALRECMDLALTFSTDFAAVALCDVIIMTVGTPVDEHLNPDLAPVYTAIKQIRPYLRDQQTIILRSTLYPGTSQRLHEWIQGIGLNIGICFCPERIAQGMALRELHDLPQIISGSDSQAVLIARRVFSAIAKDIVELGMTEAELAKLYTNCWRYIRFAVANQFYMIATEKGLDFDRIRSAMMYNYPRAADFPAAGFAAGPCLFKDTMQLAAYNRQNFAIGHAAMLINETMPNFLVDQIKKRRSLSNQTVGIIGMAFKPNNDDKRESLAYKLRKLLVQENATVMCTDPFIKDDSFYPVEEVMRQCEILFVGCPHALYKELDYSGKDVLDCWGVVENRALGASF